MNEKIIAVRIVLDDNSEVSIPKDRFLEKVREEYMYLLSEDEVNKNEMYRLVGFTQCVLERIRDDK